MKLLTKPLFVKKHNYKIITASESRELIQDELSRIVYNLQPGMSEYQSSRVVLVKVPN